MPEEKPVIGCNAPHDEYPLSDYDFPRNTHYGDDDDDSGDSEESDDGEDSEETEGDEDEKDGTDEEEDGSEDEDDETEEDEKSQYAYGHVIMSYILHLDVLNDKKFKDALKYICNFEYELIYDIMGLYSEYAKGSDIMINDPILTRRVDHTMDRLVRLVK